MARMLNPGDVVNGYTIEALLSNGAMAASFRAKARDGAIVFLKRYKSPSVTVPWYRDYVAYQAELKRRVEASPARNFTYRFVDFFEATFGHPMYFQAFEFVEGGHDLRRLLESGSALKWEQRVTLAKVMMAGIAALHAAGIIHTDLKPENIQLFEDASITAKYRLKLIDMDFSILADRTAPWHGKAGYVGTPGYHSPEHLRGQVPTEASDVFTCGLMLHELLCGGHPFSADDESVYREAALAGGAGKPSLMGTFSAPADGGSVAKALLACLSPDPLLRPKAADVLAVLNGKGPVLSAATWKCPDCGFTNPEAQVECKGGCGHVRIHPTLVLRGGSPGEVRMSIRTSIGRRLLTPLVGEDKKFAAEPQFHLEKSPTHGGWIICKDTQAPNQTYLDGRPLGTDPRLLSTGSVITIGPDKAKVTVELVGL